MAQHGSNWAVLNNFPPTHTNLQKILAVHFEQDWYPAACMWQGLHLACGKVCTLCVAKSELYVWKACTLRVAKSAQGVFSAATLKQKGEQNHTSATGNPLSALLLRKRVKAFPQLIRPIPSGWLKPPRTVSNSSSCKEIVTHQRFFLVDSRLNHDCTGSVHDSTCSTRTSFLSSQNLHCAIPSSYDANGHVRDASS